MKPPPTLHPDLAAVIHEVLNRAPQPLNLTKLRSQLKGPFKVTAKLKDTLLALLEADSDVHIWPAVTAKAGPRYWTRDAHSWAEPIMLAAAAEAPLPPAKVIGAVSKQYGKGPATSLLADLLASGQLIRVPLFGGTKAKLCSRIADEAAFRAELDSARAILEAGYKRLGITAEAPLTKPEAAPADDDYVLEALATLEPRKGLLVTAPRIHRAFPDRTKEEIDAALLRLQEARRVILHRHSNPQSLSEEERQSLIHDQSGAFYVGACWRVQED